VSRVLGVDLGSRRIGLAASDPSGVLASPRATLERSSSVDGDHRAIEEGFVSVTPLHANLTHLPTLPVLEGWGLELPG